jgi:hypothetical protein
LRINLKLIGSESAERSDEHHLADLSASGKFPASGWFSVPDGLEIDHVL